MKNFFIYLFDIQTLEYVGEKARWVIGKFIKTVKVLRYNKNFIHTNAFDSFFKCFRCSSCDCFSNKYLATSKDRVQCIYPKSVFILRETLFEKFEGFNIPVSKVNTLFINLAIFDFDSICFPSDELKATQTTTRIGKHVPISVSKYSKLINEPIFLEQESAKTYYRFLIKLGWEQWARYENQFYICWKSSEWPDDELNERCRNHPTENSDYEDWVVWNKISWVVWNKIWEVC